MERCLTLVGPGGVGKTRLAYELATRAESGRGLAPDGVVVVELAQVQDPRATGFVLAELLGVRGDDLVAAAVDHLADRRALVVLDNCEHVVDAVRSLVRRLLGAAPQVHVLATSREPLGVPGEWVHRLSPLPVPPPGDPGAAGSPAVRLFRDRASRATGGAFVVNGPESDAALERVAEVCRHLDGLPLALELAAAWLPAVGLAGLRDRLDHRLDIGPSRSVGDDRHGTLRRTIAWSYDLLTADEQRLFRHLCVVPDRFEVELAEYIAATVEVGDHPSAAVPVWSTALWWLRTPLPNDPPSVCSRASGRTGWSASRPTARPTPPSRPCARGCSTSPTAPPWGSPVRRNRSGIGAW